MPSVSVKPWSSTLRTQAGSARPGASASAPRPAAARATCSDSAMRRPRRGASPSPPARAADAGHAACHVGPYQPHMDTGWAMQRNSLTSESCHLREGTSLSSLGNTTTSIVPWAAAAPRTQMAVAAARSQHPDARQWPGAPSDPPCLPMTVQRTSCPTLNSSASAGTAAAATAAARPAAVAGPAAAAAAAAAAASALATSSARTSDACRRSCGFGSGLSQLRWVHRCFDQEAAAPARSIARERVRDGASALSVHLQTGAPRAAPHATPSGGVAGPRATPPPGRHARAGRAAG